MSTTKYKNSVLWDLISVLCINMMAFQDAGDGN